MPFMMNHPRVGATDWMNLNNLWSRGVPVWKAAYQLEVSERSVRRKIAEGELPAIKMGNSWRIVPDFLEEIVAKRDLGTASTVS